MTARPRKDSPLMIGSPRRQTIVTLSLLAAALSPWALDTARADSAAEQVENGLERVLASPAEAAGDHTGVVSTLLDVLQSDAPLTVKAVAVMRLSDFPEESFASPRLATALETLVKASEAPEAGPVSRMVGTRAALMLANVAERAGRHDDAMATAQRAGVVHRWLIIGPFGATQGSHLHHRAFGPEVAARKQEMDVNSTWKGARGPVGWRRVGPLSATGRVEQRRLNRRRGVFYLLAQGRAHDTQSAAPAELVISSGGSFKVWLNGQLVIDGDRGEARFDDEVVIPMSLSPGWNRLVVKSSTPGVAVSARLRRLDGGQVEWSDEELIQPLPATAEAFRPQAREGESGEPRWPDVGPGPIGIADPVATGLADELGDSQLQAQAAVTGGEKARLVSVATTPDQAFTRAALGLRALWNGRPEWAIAQLRGAAGALPDNPHLHYHLARALDSAVHLAESIRQAEASASYEAALKRDELFAPALLRRARRLSRSSRPVDAWQTLGKALTRAPGHLAAIDRRYDLAAAAGWEKEAEEALALRESMAPDHSSTWLRRARHEERRGNSRAALQSFQLVWEGDRRLGWVLERLARLRLDQGDMAGALADRATLVRQFPNNPRHLSGLAEVLLILATRHSATMDSQMLVGSAVGLLREAAARRPDDHAPWTAMGDALLRWGNRAAAIDAYGQALIRNPGRHGLRRLRDTLASGHEDAFWDGWQPDVAAVVAAAPSQADHPKSETLCLFDQMVTRVYSDGSRSTVVHQVQHILDRAGVERYGLVQTDGELWELRTLTAGGRSLEPIVVPGTVGFQLPGLEPGASISMAYRTHEPSADPSQLVMGPFYFRDPELTEPFLLSRWILILPRQLADQLVVIRRNGVDAPLVQEQGDLVVWTFEQLHQPSAEPEPGMPTADDVLPHALVVGRRRWEAEVARMGGQLSGMAVITPEISLWSRSRLADAKLDPTRDTTADCADALYLAVAEHVRSASGPSQAATVLSARAGSRPQLFVAALRAVGIQAALAQSSPGPGFESSPDTQWQIPAASVFAFPFVRVSTQPGAAAETLWYHFTSDARILPPRTIPHYLAGAPAVVFGTWGPESDRIGNSPFASAGEGSHAEVALAKDGNAAVRLESVSRHVGAFDLKAQARVAANDLLENWVAGQAASTFPGASLESFSMPHLEDPLAPFALTWQARVPGLGRPQEDALSVGLPMQRLQLLREHGGKTERQHPYVMRQLKSQRDEAEIRLDPRLDLPHDLPEPLVIYERWGSYSLTWKSNPTRHSVGVVRSFQLTVGRLSPTEYRHFLDALGRIDDAERRRLLLPPRKGS